MNSEEHRSSSSRPLRAAWVEIDLARLRRNFELINRDKPPGLQVLSVLKDNGYGHGAVRVAQTALKSGVNYLGVGTLDEAMELRDPRIAAPILLLGERQEEELSMCVEHGLVCCVQEIHIVEKLGKISERAGRQTSVHIKINTGMNRYGARWNEVMPLVERILSTRSLNLEGVLSHFAMSDETDKTFALLQLERFNSVLAELKNKNLQVRYRHICNSGGFLDLPQAHGDMVRIGLLQFGVFPSKVCRRISGIEPIMTVKARIAAIQNIAKDDIVGYGLRYKAEASRRIAVIPIGYGDGFPRMRNQGCVLIHGQRAPLVGGVAMDALMVDITEIPQAKMWDEVVIMGRQGAEEISVNEVAQWKNSVSYDVLTGWRERLPRVYLNEKADA